MRKSSTHWWLHQLLTGTPVLSKSILKSAQPTFLNVNYWWPRPHNLTGDCYVFKFLRLCVDGTHLMRFQTENAVIRFRWRTVDGAKMNEKYWNLLLPRLETWRFLLCIIRFGINSSTGEISTTESLDFERFHSHLLIVQAEDQGIPQSRRTAVQVLINVIDVNDNAPKFFETQPDLNTDENDLFCPTHNTTVCICFIIFL